MAQDAGIQLRAAQPTDLMQIYWLLERNDMLGEIESQDCVVAEKKRKIAGICTP